jgi:nicotinamidase-related amidase
MLAINKEKTTLLIMDVQNDIVHEDGKYKDFGSPAHARERNIIGNIKKVLNMARDKGMKVVHVKFGMRDFEEEVKNNHTPILDAVSNLQACDLDSWGGDVHHDLQPKPGESIVEKNRINAFHNTNLKQILDEAGIDTLILTGVATNYVVEATARYASDDDYRLIILEDCCSSMNQELHDFSMQNILPNLGQISTSDEIAAIL